MNSFNFIILCVLLNPCGLLGAWPESRDANIFLLGLFEDSENVNQSSNSASSMFKAAILLAQKYNVTVDRKPIGWLSASTDGYMINALRHACVQTSMHNVIGIVGPGLSREAHLLANFASKIGIPLISYGATDPDLSERITYPSFYRVIPSDHAAAQSIARLFRQFDWNSTIIIYQNDAFGENGAKVITAAFLDSGLRIDKTFIYDLSIQRIRGNFSTELLKSSTRIVLVWAEVDATISILRSALNYDVVGPRFTWILSIRVPLHVFNSSSYSSLVGILTIEPIASSDINYRVNQTLLEDAKTLWKQYEPETYPESSQIDSYSLFTFDAAWTLIHLLGTFCSSADQNQSSSCLTITSSPVCFDRRLVQTKSFLKALDRVHFLGVTGFVNFSENSTDRNTGSYYSLYNLQHKSNSLSFVRVLDYSDSDHWRHTPDNQSIIWPGNNRTKPNGRATLQGIHLKIGIIEVDPFTMIGNGSVPTGFIPDLIETLRNKLGFIPNIQVAKNVTYARLIRTVADGTYDIVVGDVTVTADRREIVGFSNAIFDNSLRIIMRKSNDQAADLASFLKPFSLKLWWLVLGTCTYAGILICVIERNENQALRNRSFISQIILSIWYAFGNMVGYGVEFHASTAAGRLMTTGLYILSLILVASYTANLASKLTILKVHYMVSSIDDLKRGKIPPNRIGIFVDSTEEDYFLREISSNSKNYFPIHSRQEMYDNLRNHKIDAALIDTGIAEYVTNNVHCDLTLVEEIFDRTVFGIVTPKEWVYGQELDVMILSLRESGYLDNLRKKWFQSRKCGESQLKSSAISIESIGGLFITFFAISVLALLMYIWRKRHRILSKFYNEHKKPNTIVEEHEFTLTSNQPPKSQERF